LTTKNEKQQQGKNGNGETMFQRNPKREKMREKSGHISIFSNDEQPQKGKSGITGP